MTLIYNRLTVHVHQENPESLFSMIIMMMSHSKSVLEIQCERRTA